MPGQTRKPPEATPASASDQQQTAAPDQSTPAPAAAGPAGAAGKAANVPRTPQAVDAEIEARFPDIVKKYREKPKTADPRYTALIQKVQAIPKGTMTKEQDKLLMGEFNALAKTIAAEKQSAEGTDIRTVYTGMEEPMHEWQVALEGSGASLEEQARLSHMWRERKKMFCRELMTDTNAVLFLNSRDDALYGNPSGPTFEKLMTDHRANGLSDDAAHKEIIGSSRRSNAQVNQAMLGNAAPNASAGPPAGTPQSKL